MSTTKPETLSGTNRTNLFMILILSEIGWNVFCPNAIIARVEAKREVPVQ
jgi:hypothetical protein